MKILLIDWGSFGFQDIVTAFHNLGHETVILKHDGFRDHHNTDYIKALEAVIDSNKPELVFSSNYAAATSSVCLKHSIPYAAWVYDSPLMHLYSATLINSCNYVFIFDSDEYNTFAGQGINTVYYLPLAASTARLDKMIPDGKTHQLFDSDIAFVGSLYNEKREDLFNLDCLSDYSKGYLNAVIEAQSLVQGCSFTEQILAGRFLNELREIINYTPDPYGVEADTYIFSRYFIDRKITSKERTHILDMLSKEFQVKLYTHNPTPNLPHVINVGAVDPFTTQPYVFKCSKINLNITLRSIHTGIPLRAIEIMGAGGFLMSNFQSDFLMYFEPDVDFVYYEDDKDLIDKCRFYLSHDSERNRIADNGHKKIKSDFSYEAALQKILNTIFK